MPDLRTVLLYTACIAYWLVAFRLYRTRLWLRFPCFTLLCCLYPPALLLYDPQPKAIWWLGGIITVTKISAVLEAWSTIVVDLSYPLRRHLEACCVLIATAMTALMLLFYKGKWATDYQSFHNIFHCFMAGLCIAASGAVAVFVPIRERLPLSHGILMALYIVGAHFLIGMRYVIVQMLGTELTSEELTAAWRVTNQQYLAACTALLGGWWWVLGMRGYGPVGGPPGPSPP